MASQKDTNVHLEAVEATENKGREPKEIRNARVDGIPKRQHSEGILGYCEKRYTNTYHNKQKTCIPRIL